MQGGVSKDSEMEGGQRGGGSREEQLLEVEVTGSVKDGPAHEEDDCGGAHGEDSSWRC